MKEPLRIYERRKDNYLKLLEKQKNLANRLSNYRLLSVVLGLGITFIFYRYYSATLGAFAGILTIIVFAFLALHHRKVLDSVKRSEILSEINQKGIDRLSGEWVNFPSSGEEFKDDDHPYASDLDMFGKASFFQWMNSTVTIQGRETLAKMLKEPLKEPEEIMARQHAITEIANKLTWRQRFEAEGLVITEQQKPTEQLFKWAEKVQDTYLQLSLKIVMRLLPAITVLTIFLYFFAGAVPWTLPTILVIVQFLLLRLYGKERSRVLTMVYSYEKSLRTYGKMLESFEKQDFTSEWFITRQRKLLNAKGQAAHEQIRQLSKISEKISNRENAIFLILNIILLWDYQCIFALEEWKKRSGKLLRNWFEIISEVEAISSLANMRFENPDWVMPEIVDPKDLSKGNKGVYTKQLGHPLLTNRVSNDFQIREPQGVVLITGSNMSGKSTFLRTIGSNLILAYIGAPVCAEEFRCSIMNVWTCMRISDNLEQSISYFYAEILRIKKIVEAAKNDKPVFFLLDEIFKGTNSHDRHQGAKALIKQLQKDRALGLVSTHDLELGDLEKESKGRVKNYHFREFYENDEIRFDYKLRPGISTTRNAIYLIKLAGIEIEQ